MRECSSHRGFGCDLALKFLYWQRAEVLDEENIRTRDCWKLRLQPPSTIDVPSVSLMLSYARQGLGISLVPGLALARSDRRRLVIERADVAPIDVHLVCRPTLKRTRPVARFLDGLAEEARRAAALPAVA